MRITTATGLLGWREYAMFLAVSDRNFLARGQGPLGEPKGLISFSFFGRIRLCLVPRKYKGKKKNAKENDFLMFGCPMKNIKENQI